MTVYVDRAFHKYKRMQMSHMMADTDEELERMARRLGLKPEWKHGDHYDVSKKTRDLALFYGAKGVDSRFLVKLRKMRREGI